MCIRDRRYDVLCQRLMQEPVSYTHLDVYKRQPSDDTELNREAMRATRTDSVSDRKRKVEKPQTRTQASSLLMPERFGVHDVSDYL